MAHKLLDRVENQLTHGSPNKLKHGQITNTASANESSQLVVHSYPPLLTRARLISIMLLHALRMRIEAGIRVILRLLRQRFPCFDRFITSAEEMRLRAAYKFQEGFAITKDKLDLYKEYLDVLSRQFMVQDGRSLEHVHVSL